MTRVKICGINDPAAFDTAVEAGADWVGFVFFPPSPRSVSAAVAAALSASAQQRAERKREDERRSEECIRALVAVNGALSQWRKQETAWKSAQGEHGAPLPDAVALALRVNVAIALRRWEAAMDDMCTGG